MENSNISIKYKIKEKDEIKLFGEDFCDNNKNNFKMIINGNELDLSSFFKINKETNKESLEVKLNQMNYDIHLNDLFDGCDSLISITNCKLDTSKVTDISMMFNKYISLISISDDMANWDTSNVTKMYAIFQDCESLTSIGDISKWNISKVDSLRTIFYRCKSITSLPDISKMEYFNYEGFMWIVHGCEKLTSVPDISGWDTSKVTDIYSLFNSCKSLTKIPDISNWNTSEIKDMKYIFMDCESLESLPDISKWDT